MSDGKIEIKHKVKLDSIKSFIYLLIAIFLVWIVSGYIVSRLSTSWEHRGQFGDMFGAINALFSGLAFAGVIYTIMLQRKELALQRDEIRKSTNELEAQKNVMDLQSLKASFSSC